MLAGVLGPVLNADEAKNLGAGSTATLDIPSFGVLVKALQTNSDVDVLSNPHLLIMEDLIAQKYVTKQGAKDPWGKDFTLRCPGQKDPESADVSSSGPDKQDGTADDIKSWE